MKSASDRRPPLAESPQRPRARRNLCPSSSIPIPSAASLMKSQLPNCLSALKESQFLPISCELQALVKMVEEEFGQGDLSPPITTKSTNSTSLFERGRLYDEYSARRNERLKRKKGETVDERPVHDPGSTVEFGKRRNAKKTESLRRSVPANFSVGRGDIARSSVKISKENKKPIMSRNSEKVAVDGVRRMVTRSSRKI